VLLRAGWFFASDTCANSLGLLSQVVEKLVRQEQFARDGVWVKRNVHVRVVGVTKPRFESGRSATPHPSLLFQVPESLFIFTGLVRGIDFFLIVVVMLGWSFKAPAIGWAQGSRQGSKIEVNVPRPVPLAIVFIDCDIA
jgi:hypothetical protein